MIRAALFFLTFLFAAAVFCPPVVAADYDDVLSSIPDDMLEARVPGLAIVIIENGEIARQKSFGTRRNGAADLLLLDDVFEGASIGKVIAAYRLHTLVETGVISLDDTVEDDRIRSDCGLPTIGAVLSHTAGFGNDTGAETFVINCETKGRFAYGGEGYVALESVFEQAVGSSSERDIRQSLLAPLEMSYSDMGWTQSKIVPGHPDLLFGLLTGRAESMDRDLAWLSLLGVLLVFIGIASWLVLQFRPFMSISLSIILFASIAGGWLYYAATSQIAITSMNRPNDIASSLKTTAPDLARFAMELMDPELMRRDTRDLMLSPAVTLNRRVAWGYGIGIDQSDGVATYWHWGSNPGYQSLFVIEPEAGRGVVVMTNGGGFSDYLIDGRGGYVLARRIATQVLGIDGHWMTSEP